MFQQGYKNSLDLILTYNKQLTERIKTMIDSIPENLKTEIKNNNETGMEIDGDNLWVYVQDEETFSITKGVKKGRSSRDEISLLLYNIPSEKIKNIAKYNDYELLGFVVFYLYDDHKYAHKPLQLNYDIYLKRHDDKFIISYESKINTWIKENKSVIAENGFEDMVKSMKDNFYYTIDVNSIIPKKR